jgi:hypothetical protein
MSHKSADRLDRVGTGRPHGSARRACTPRSLCARCALVEVIAYRFSIFRRAFGRTPEPDEPIFFNPNSTAPAVPPREEFRKQLSEAASRVKVPLKPVLQTLELD